MRCARPRNRRESPSDRSLARRMRKWVALGAVLGIGFAFPCRSQDRVLVQGLFDGEFWKTDSDSRLLSKNKGDPTLLGRLRLWSASEITRGFEGVFMGEFENVEGSEDEGTDQPETEQLLLRYTFKPPLHLMVQAGRIPMPLGNFSRRYLSNINPLIGVPDSYDVSYPTGIQLSGSASRFDFSLAAVDRPMVNVRYVPEPDTAVRPALSLGVTPTTGLRLGAYFTRGSYLNREVESALPPGTEWKDYGQDLKGAELQFSRGYFELNADLALSTYEVPTQDRDIRGRAYYFEPKYTWSPRFFTALRVERNRYAFILPVSSAFWIGNDVAFTDLEAGVGYRVSPNLLLKLAARKDRWTVTENLEPFLQNGYSAAVQVSYRFDVLSWFQRPQ